MYENPRTWNATYKHTEDICALCGRPGGYHFTDRDPWEYRTLPATGDTKWRSYCDHREHRAKNSSRSFSYDYDSLADIGL